MDKRENEATAKLSQRAYDLYLMMRRNASLEVEEDEFGPELAELKRYGLTVPNELRPKRPKMALDAGTAYREQVDAGLDELEALTRRLRELRQVLDTLPDPHDGIVGGLRVLSSKDEANRLLREAEAKEQSEVLTAHPLDRPQSATKARKPKEEANLRAGIGIRTIYPVSARTRPGESEWADTVIANGGEVRVSSRRFPRMVIYSHLAVVPDYTQLGPNGEPSRDRAVALLHPALVAYARQIFEGEWAEAVPWAVAPLPEPVPEEVRVTDIQRSIIKMRMNEWTYDQIARALSINERTARRHIGALGQILGVKGELATVAAWTRFEMTQNRVAPHSALPTGKPSFNDR
ncbi:MULTISPECIES: hypothetical protein [Streptomyces]|uniref:HTH luxR-type domain-containing protein n=1 Tax=Streptomyces noboritoensis TaxID=67337 RepID=A0ABV6TE41_9ACTN|nr:hypothetical protein [Streptomyces melanogenes]GGP78772.1 hypothetical protein GCM10010278_66580 [Streptomyces melanogenes]